jgi:undecaprenyl-diphosphatase
LNPSLILLLKALVMGVVEGLTEFLPISSTGHLILVGDLLAFHDEKSRAFEIAIQTGAMLAVVWEYRAKLWAVLHGLTRDRSSRRFAANLVAAFVPAAVAGLAFGDAIERHLFRPVPVALALMLGGVVILWAEKRRHTTRVLTVDDMTWRDAVRVGLAQCLALVPGTSRAGATIIGGLFFGLSRQAATEFSFFLALPTLTAAGAWQLWDVRDQLCGVDLGWFGMGFAAAFVSALLCVRWLLRYISRHDFTAFAWYRIALGIVVLVTAWTGTVFWTVD